MLYSVLCGRARCWSGLGSHPLMTSSGSLHQTRALRPYQGPIQKRLGKPPEFYRGQACIYPLPREMSPPLSNIHPSVDPLSFILFLVFFIFVFLKTYCVSPSRKGRLNRAKVHALVRRIHLSEAFGHHRHLSYLTT